MPLINGSCTIDVEIDKAKHLASRAIMRLGELCNAEYPSRSPGMMNGPFPNRTVIAYITF